MSDAETGTAPAQRRAWLRDLRRVDERQENDLAGDFDAHWGEIEPMHHSFGEQVAGGLIGPMQVLDHQDGPVSAR